MKSLTIEEMADLTVNQMVTRRELLVREINELKPYAEGKGKHYREVEREVGFIHRERYLLGQRIREAKQANARG